MTKIHELHHQGQSVWLDYIRRSMLDSGELARMVDEGVRGLTSNPTIFQRAIAGSEDYDAALRRLTAAEPGASIAQLFEHLAVADIQAAADVLRPVYDSSGGADGYVSLEVSPHLAHDTAGTVAEAHRLWDLVERPNLMIKVPATPAGIPAVERLIADGLNVNATLMFSMDHYEAVAGAYLRGLERTPHPARVASVASFFVSRVDTKVDAALDKTGSEAAAPLRGTIAVANSKLVYQRFKELFGDEFAPLRERGARPQRVLWASTSTKNPEYSDVLYVDDLIGPHTVNTMPPVTLEAFLDHGRIDGGAIESGLDDARSAIAALGGLGIDLAHVTDELQDEGVEAFANSYDDLLAALGDKVESLRR